MTKGRKHCPAWQPDLLGLTTPPQSHSRESMREVGDRWPGPQSILPPSTLLSLLGRYWVRIPTSPKPLAKSYPGGPGKRDVTGAPGPGRDPGSAVLFVLFFHINVWSNFCASGGPRCPGCCEWPSTRVSAVPRTVRAPMPAGLFPQLLRWLLAWPGHRWPPVLSTVPVSAPNPERMKFALILGRAYV